MLSSLIQRASALRGSIEGNRRPSGLDSTQEDLHTQDLLFTHPDEVSSDFLESGNAISAKARLALGRVSDCYGGPEISLPQDIRILIAYSPDAGEKTLLFDSHAPKIPSLHGTLASDSGSGTNARRRASSHSTTRPMSPTARARLYDERSDTLALLECVFGTVPLSYKGPGTRLHILGDEIRASDLDGSSLTEKLQSGRPRLAPGKSSRQLQSTSPMLSGYSPSEGSRGARSTRPGKRLLLTRVFSVEVPRIGWDVDDEDNRITVRLRQARETTEFVTFAVAMVLRTPKENPFKVFSGQSLSGQSSILAEDGSLSPQRRASYHTGHTQPGSTTQRSRAESINTHSPDTQFDTDLVGEFWSNLSRPLAALHRMIKLRLVEVMTDDLTLALRETKPGSQPRRSPNLPPGRLQNDPYPRNFSDEICIRIQRGLRIPRVVPGHDRWGAWKEESRWFDRWATAHGQQRDFLAKILTVFFAVNKETLSSLDRFLDSPHAPLRASHGEDTGFPHRTIIVSDDKMAARRLEFLLAAFYPGARRSNNSKIEISDGSTPPNHFSLSPFSPRTASNHRGIHIRKSSVSKGAVDAAVSQPGSTSQSPNLRSEHAQRFLDKHHGRRRAESRETRSLDIPRPPLVSLTPQPKSTATTATAVHLNAHTHVASPGTWTPVDAQGTTASGSTASLAAISLRPAWNSGGLENVPAKQPSRESSWGWFTSVLSGPKSQQPAQRTASVPALLSDERRPSDSGTVIAKHEPMNTAITRELTPDHATTSLPPGDAENRMDRETAVDLTPGEEVERGRTQYDAGEQSWQSDMGGSFDEPFKISIDPDDGVVDVGMSLSGNFASGLGSGSPLTSPEASAIWSTSVGRTNRPDPRPHQRTRNQSSAQLAGWLKHFHPDFALQANKPDSQLVEQIMWAMELEPTPMPAVLRSALGGRRETTKWIDVTETLIIDLQKFEIKRLKLRRLVKILPIARVARDVRMSGYGNPYEDSLAPMGTEFMGDGENVEDNEIIEENWTNNPADSELLSSVEAILKSTPTGSGLQSGDRSSVGSLERSGLLSRTTSSIGSIRAGHAMHNDDSQDAGPGHAITDNPEFSHGYGRPMRINSRKGEEVRASIYDALGRIVQQTIEGDSDDGRSEEMKKKGVLRVALKAWLAEEL